MNLKCALVHSGEQTPVYYDTPLTTMTKPIPLKKKKEIAEPWHHGHFWITTCFIFLVIVLFPWIAYHDGIPVTHIHDSPVNKIVVSVLRSLNASNFFLDTYNNISYSRIKKFGLLYSILVLTLLFYNTHSVSIFTLMLSVFFILNFVLFFVVLFALSYIFFHDLPLKPPSKYAMLSLLISGFFYFQYIYVSGELLNFNIDKK